MHKFSPKDCPKSLTVFDWMTAQIDYEDAKRAAPPRTSYPDILSFKIRDWQPDKMLSCTDEILEKYGDHRWATGSKDAMDLYTGFSLVYNPNHQEGLDPNASTLGTKKNSTGEEMYWSGTHNHEFLKDSYYDTYGFNLPSPASQHGYLGEFLTRCRASRVRSRVGIIHGDKPVPATFGWHKDEEIWQNLRINIPVTTTESMKFQFEDKAPVHLDVGWAYSFDSNIPHRVFSTEVSDCCRIHLVLGFSPWFNYDAGEDAWYPNEFYGKKHPFDMLVDGDIFQGLDLDESKVLKKSKLLYKYRNPFSERHKI